MKWRGYERGFPVRKPGVTQAGGRTRSHFHCSEEQRCRAEPQLVLQVQKGAVRSANDWQLWRDRPSVCSPLDQGLLHFLCSSSSCLLQYLPGFSPGEMPHRNPLVPCSSPLPTASLLWVCNLPLHPCPVCTQEAPQSLQHSSLRHHQGHLKATPARK